jgi:NAD(P)-dependent dehydrogenase (short-subunit alcohol dehydrogenase family)
VRGLLFTVQKVLPLFRDGGAIILISSIAAFQRLETERDPAFAALAPLECYRYYT